MKEIVIYEFQLEQILEPLEKILWKVGDSVTLMINNYKEHCE